MKKLCVNMLPTVLYFFAPIVQAESYDCLVEPHEVVEVGSPVIGIVKDIPVERGDRVKQGQLIARLDSEVERISLELAQVRYEHQKVKYERLKKLNDNSLTSKESLDDAAAEMNLSHVELRRREALFKQKEIVSPISGVVVERLLAQGEYAYEQTPVMTVAQINPLNVEVLVPTNMFGKIKKGSDVDVVLEQPLGGRHQATVIIVDNILDAASSTFGVRLELLNPDFSIPAGLKCTAVFGST